MEGGDSDLANNLLRKKREREGQWSMKAMEKERNHESTTNDLYIYGEQHYRSHYPYMSILNDDNNDCVCFCSVSTVDHDVMFPILNS